jgi:guanylate kinase
MLIGIVGPSGTGKSSLIRAYAEQSKGQLVCFLTSTTTRAPRASDSVIGTSKEYEYADEASFEASLRAGQFLKPFGDYGKRYATRLTYLEDERVWGNRCAYFAVLLIEAAQLFAKYAMENDRGEVHFFYLDMQHEEERIRRLHERGETNPKRFEPELDAWREKAKDSGIPFTYLNAERDSAEDLAKEVYYYVFGPGRTEE